MAAVHIFQPCISKLCDMWEALKHTKVQPGGGVCCLATVNPIRGRGMFPQFSSKRRFFFLFIERTLQFVKKKLETIDLKPVVA